MPHVGERAVNSRDRKYGDMKACSSDSELTCDAFLQDLVSSLHGSVLAIDRQHRVLLCNERWQDFNGLTFDEVVGRDVFDVLPGLRV